MNDFTSLKDRIIKDFTALEYRIMNDSPSIEDRIIEEIDKIVDKYYDEGVSLDTISGILEDCVRSIDDASLAVKRELMEGKDIEF